MTSSENPYKSPESSPTFPPRGPSVGRVWVELDSKWVSRIRSRWYLLISALTGVSVTIAPLAIFYLGGVEPRSPVYWLAVAICFAVIYCIPGWYMRLAGEVLQQLYSGEFVDAERAE